MSYSIGETVRVIDGPISVLHHNIDFVIVEIWENVHDIIVAVSVKRIDGKAICYTDFLGDALYKNIVKVNVQNIKPSRYANKILPPIMV